MSGTVDGLCLFVCMQSGNNMHRHRTPGQDLQVISELLQTICAHLDGSYNYAIIINYLNDFLNNNLKLKHFYEKVLSILYLCTFAIMYSVGS